jgi:putative transposase
MSDPMANERQWQEALRRADILSKLTERPGDAEVRAAMSALARLRRHTAGAQRATHR